MILCAIFPALFLPNVLRAADTHSPAASKPETADGRPDWRLPVSSIRDLSTRLEVKSSFSREESGSEESGSEKSGALVPASVIKPLSTQIVSPGQVIRLRVEARLDDGRQPRLLIDRLPLQASFDENPDGSHTLYWPTREHDQGEHRFRITALHPDDGTVVSDVGALVIVGHSGGGVTQADVSVVPDVVVTEYQLPVIAAPPDPYASSGGTYFPESRPAFLTPTSALDEYVIEGQGANYFDDPGDGGHYDDPQG